MMGAHRAVVSPVMLCRVFVEDTMLSTLAKAETEVGWQDSEKENKMRKKEEKGSNWSITGGFSPGWWRVQLCCVVFSYDVSCSRDRA